MNPNFEEYSLEELEEVKSHIDNEMYPERYKKVCILIDNINSGKHTPLPKEQIPNPFLLNEPLRKVDSTGIYIPNSLTKCEIIENLIIIILLISYGVYGYYSGELLIPISKHESAFIYGNSILIANLAFLCGCFYTLSHIVDHYDKRDNEIYYHEFRMWVKYLGIFLLILACIIS
ncbi:hypothetical protein WNY51_03745 [Pseudocolwellia sp. AS88]|uniref:hypothetical protein n=1 Tax=Pseudocolwellia sp. AS88 TaxID=3063958 RepID=UPI0026EFD88A|nr:hypothetical protein [Pseudocolwellia sp. AS88]MDO7085686.1 hypothetical protein [Pseudocolwellia sp. AS88]